MSATANRRRTRKKNMPSLYRIGGLEVLKNRRGRVIFEFGISAASGMQGEKGAVVLLRLFVLTAGFYCLLVAFDAFGALYRNNLKNQFLAASAFPRDSDPHLRLAYRQWSLAPYQNGVELPCQNPDSSSYFGISKQAQEQIQQIDQQILQLEEIKRGYEAKAIRHEEQVERLQFQDQAYLEMRRHQELADENWEMAARVQEEINRLKKQRMLILRQNGEGGRLPPPGGDGFEDI